MKANLHAVGLWSCLVTQRAGWKGETNYCLIRECGNYPMRIDRFPDHRSSSESLGDRSALTTGGISYVTSINPSTICTSRSLSTSISTSLKAVLIEAMKEWTLSTRSTD